MTHEYTIGTGGIVLGSGEPPETPRTAIAWAVDRVLAVGSDDEVRAISRGDSTFIDLNGSVVTPAPDDPAAAQALARSAVEGKRALGTVALLEDAGLIPPGSTIETGTLADLAFWSADPGTVPPAAALSVRILGIVRAGAFTQGDEHVGPFARLPRPGAARGPAPGTPEWLRLAVEFNDGVGARILREVLASADDPGARDEALALWREVFDDWLIDRGLAPTPGSLPDVIRALGLPEDG